MFYRGDIVWGKLQKYPWWPAIVLNCKDCGRDENRKGFIWIMWFDDHKISEINCLKIIDFEKGFSDCFNKKAGKRYFHAVEEALIILAKRHKVKYRKVPELFQWAEDGFKSSFKHKFNSKKVLPEIVVKALDRNDFKRTDISDSEEDSEEEIESLVSEVLKGSKLLEDICISCCKKTARVICPHPLFIGGLCYVCKNNVRKICDTPTGKVQEFCFVCGQGGDIVYCSNTICLRSYCQLCIEFLTPKGTYTKILKNDDWVCYACKADLNSKCLIQMRKKWKFSGSGSLVTPVSESKLPIRVIAHSLDVLSILKSKKFIVDVFCLSPADLYHDYFSEISADLVCGSDSINTELCEKIKGTDSFCNNFHEFLFRLNNAKLYKLFVYFIFLCMDNLLYEEHVTRFLEVSPFHLKVGNVTLLVWSNIPNSSSIVEKKWRKKLECNAKNIEIYIFSHFIESLGNYFLKDV